MTKYQNRAEYFPAELSERDPDYSPIVVRGSNFVTPAARPEPVQVYPAAAPQWPIAAEQPAAQSVVKGSYQDRAQAFSHVVGRLALTMGALSVIVGMVGFGVPVFSLAVLAWFGTVYAGVWLVAYVIYAFVSAEGVAWLHTQRGWRYLDREQKHRHALEKHANGMGKGRR